MKLINKISLRRRDTLLIGLMLLAITALTISCEADETQEVTTLTNLTFEDNFDTAGAPNGAVWNYDIGNGTADTGPGWGNNELQYYTSRPENIRVEDGVLKIITNQESFEGSGYTSARINTKGLFTQKYGRFEARIQLPWGQGIWPAFWMLGENIDTVSWPFCGEIDVMENRGQEPTIVTGSVHGPGYSGGNAISKEYDLVNDRLDTGFHTFGIEWGPDFINYYVDDVLYNQITPEDVTGDWVFNQPFYIIMNVAVGGSFAGPPSQETVFPQTMLVDYVRVYQ